MAVYYLAADQPLHPPHGGVGSPVLEHELEVVAVLTSALEVLPLGQLEGTAVALAELDITKTWCPAAVIPTTRVRSLCIWSDIHSKG